MREVRTTARAKVRGLGGRLTAIVAVGFMLTMAAFSSGALTSATASAAGSKKALILGSSIYGGTSSHEYTSLVSQGFTPKIVTEAQWNAMTASQFGAYQVLVIGEQHPNRHRAAPSVSGRTAVTRKPRSGSGPACTDPPTMAARSCMPARPCPRAGASVRRVPSSVITTSTCPDV